VTGSGERQLAISHTRSEGTRSRKSRKATTSKIIERNPKWLVDVAGIEPATPCLQSKLKNAMWLYRLSFTYVM
jgi:hypothetical protein